MVRSSAFRACCQASTSLRGNSLLSMRLSKHWRLRMPISISAVSSQILFGQRPDAPHQLAPGLEVVFLSRRRTVSRLTPPRPGSWRAMRSSSSSTIVQRFLLSGGAEHASAVTSAWASVSYWRGQPERATSNTAKSMPPCRQAVYRAQGKQELEKSRHPLHWGTVTT